MNAIRRLGFVSAGVVLLTTALPAQSPPGRNDGDNPKPAADQYRAGHAVYVDNCIGCHGYRGEGMAGVFPSLKGSSLVGLPDPSVLINWVLHGVPPVATDQASEDGASPASYGVAMPAFYWKLSNAEIAAVASYVRNAWGNNAPAVKPSSVAKLRQATASE